ncbi:MAG: RIP metalloprotease RseP [Shimia sp.]
MDLTGLIGTFGSVGLTLLAFIVALSVIVAIHEYGHYIVGRWCGIHADVFSLGFGPVLVSRRDTRGTLWQVAALPFGGYVKFRGDANAASVGSDGTAQTMTPHDRRSTMLGAPLWARALTIAAGPVFNFILSAFVFAGIFLTAGQPAEPVRIASLTPLPVEHELQAGDEIVSIGGVPVASAADVGAAADTLTVSPLVDYRVLRDGAETVVQGPFPLLPLAAGIALESAAADAGLRPGDVVTRVDGAPIVAFRDLVVAVGAAEGAPLALTIWRDEETFETVLSPRATDERLPGGGFESNYRIGLQGGLFFEAARDGMPVGEALSRSVAQVWLIITASLDGLWNIITGAISTCNLTGPVGIAQTSGAMAAQGADSFIWFIAVLSTAVGLLNLLPIPVLDGGHLVFIGYEAVTRRPPSDRVLNVLMAAGLAVILGLMLLGLSSDFFC